MNRKAWSLKGLYAITPDCANTADLQRRVQLALTGGARILQYRNKTADPGLRLEQAQALRQLAQRHSVPFIVNDDVQLALQTDADGVHLGAQDGSLASARHVLGADRIIGVSCYNRYALAQAAVQAGADYVAFGAFFPSTVKPDAAVADVALLRRAHAGLTVPIVAIGGITVDNGASLINAGADALAVISALFEPDDIRACAQQFAGLFTSQFTVTQDPVS
ncbi:MAG: thiamine phosphate synthase [Pseudomonadota bacterium]